MTRASRYDPGVPADLPVRSLYAPSPPFRSEWLAVPGEHDIHVQQSGSPEGLPAVVLHGGPGSGCSPLLPRFFDPRRYRVICVDQRGAGLSRPWSMHVSTPKLT